MSATQSGQVRFAKVAIAAAATTTVVTAVAGKSIVVIGGLLSLSGTTPAFKFQDNTVAPVVLTGTYDVAGVYPFGAERDVPLFATSVGKQLDIVTTGTPSLQGFIAYILADN